MKPRTRAFTAFGIALPLLLASRFVPDWLDDGVRLMPLDTTVTISSEPAPATLMDFSAWDSKIPVSTDPSCTNLDAAKAPLYCYTRSVDVNLERDIRTEKVKDPENTKLNVDEKLTSDTAGDIWHFTDSVELVRHSAYPIDKPNSTFKSVSILPGVSRETGLVQRQGMQYKLPYSLEWRSYQYFDVISQQPAPIDYQEAEEQRGAKVYRSFQETDPVALADFEALGPASKFYSAEELVAAGLGPNEQVAMKQYYSTKRTVWAEQKTGTIVNEQEEPHIFLARSVDEARQTHAPTSSRTLFSTSYSFDQDSQEAQWQRAMSGVTMLKWLRIGWYLTTICIYVLLAYGLITLGRRK